MRGVRTTAVLGCWLVLAFGVAQSDGRGADARPEPPPAVADEGATDRRGGDDAERTRDEADRRGEEPARSGDGSERLGDDAGAWLRRMVASERLFAFAVSPEERSTWPAAVRTPDGGFAWPAGATLELVRANFDVRWVGRERAAGRTVVVIDLAPRHEGPGWRFWIDAVTGARVAYRATLADGRVFAEGRGDATALVPVGTAEPLRAPSAPTDARAAVWRAAFSGLDGFEPVAVERVRLGTDVPALSVTMWDGLSGAVLFVYPAARTTARLDGIVTRSVGALTLALAGPVPQAAAEAYLDALAERRWARSDLRALLREWAPDDGD